MKPFEPKPYYQPNAFEKLTKKTPKKNFLIDLNNLLAMSHLEEVTPQMIEDIKQKYELKDFHDKFHKELNAIFKEFLDSNLGKGRSKENDFQSSKRFQELLNLSETDFKEIYEPLANSVFENKVKETFINTQKYEEEEESKFESLKESLGVSNDKAKELVDKTRQAIVQDFYNKMIEDRRISPQEIEQADNLCNSLHVVPNFPDEDKKVIEKLKKLWVIENGDLLSVEPDIMLPKNEVCYLACKAILFENRKVTKSVGYGGTTFRVKIVKGVYFRAGNMGIKPHSEDELTQIDEGILYVTNKRVLFVGSKQNKTYKYSQIIDLTQFSDGIQLVKDSGRSPFFNPQDEDSEILLATIARIIKDSMN